MNEDAPSLDAKEPKRKSPVNGKESRKALVTFVREGRHIRDGERLSVEEIAEELNVSPSAIRVWAKRERLDIGSDRRAEWPSKKRALLAAANTESIRHPSGCLATHRELGERFGMSHKSVGNILWEHRPDVAEEMSLRQKKLPASACSAT
jgi:transposase